MSVEEKFIRELRVAAIEDVLKEYTEYVKDRDPSLIKNAQWRRFLTALNDAGASEYIDAVFEQFMVDVLATVLAVLDGSSNLKTLRGDFRVTYDGQPLDSTLAEIFWEREQSQS